MEGNSLGVIDSLSAGLNLVAQRVWVVAIPVLLDLWYWLGPRLSITPLLKQVEEAFLRSAPASMPEAPVSIETVIDMLDTLGQQFDLFSLLSASLLGVPSLMANGSIHNTDALEVHSWLVMAGLAALLLLVGLAVGCLYLVFIAQGVCQQPVDPWMLMRQTGTTWLRVVALGLLMLLSVITLMVPFSFLVGLVTFINGTLASFLMGIVYMGVIWLMIYLYFAIDAIVINRVGPIQAIWNSANVVARNFWSALGLIVLIFILSVGLSVVWQRLSEIHPIGTVVAITGHAFVGSGLVAASLLFYRDRYHHWKQQTA